MTLISGLPDPWLACAAVELAKILTRSAPLQMEAMDKWAGEQPWSKATSHAWSNMSIQAWAERSGRRRCVPCVVVTAAAAITGGIGPQCLTIVAVMAKRMYQPTTGMVYISPAMRLNKASVSIRPQRVRIMEA